MCEKIYLVFTDASLEIIISIIIIIIQALNKLKMNPKGADEIIFVPDENPWNQMLQHSAIPVHISNLSISYITILKLRISKYELRYANLGS